MKTFSIENFGCRATEADAQAMRSGLLARGFTLVESHGAADLVVLNTCTVTGSADAQAREAVRKIHRSNPQARIIVTGCYAQRAPEEIVSLAGVAWVIGNSHQSEIPRLVMEDGLSHETGASEIACAGTANRGQDAAGNLVPLDELIGGGMSLARGPAKILTGNIFTQTATSAAPTGLRDDRTRPILKLQDGCNNRCSYCVIPFVRGRSRSLPPADAIANVRELHAAGAKEVVLSGINLGSYGRDLAPRLSLSDLVRRILDETVIDRIRFSSIEPQHVTQDFVALFAESDRLARHFHVPLQSGSDRILRGMRRWYRAEHYAKRVDLVHGTLPDAALGADIIVGFPGETEADFRETCDFVERLPFSYLHVFSFSGRPGTAAQELEHGRAVPQPAIRDRARALRALSEKKRAEFRASQAGRTFRALTLYRRGDDWTEAITGNYLKLRIPGFHPANEWHNVCITADTCPRNA